MKYSKGSIARERIIRERDIRIHRLARGYVCFLIELTSLLCMGLYLQVRLSEVRVLFALRIILSCKNSPNSFEQGISKLTLKDPASSDRSFCIL